ncbi:hypothetical protein C1I99_31755, partial [Micromonospora deserti]
TADGRSGNGPTSAAAPTGSLNPAVPGTPAGLEPVGPPAAAGPGLLRRPSMPEAQAAVERVSPSSNGGPPHPAAGIA